jgi:hypothetical protein
MIAAALLAAFSIPAFADDVTMKTDEVTNVTNVTKASAAGTVVKQEDATQTSMKNGRSDCMKRYSTTMNMM